MRATAAVTALAVCLVARAAGADEPAPVATPPAPAETPPAPAETPPAPAETPPAPAAAPAASPAAPAPRPRPRPPRLGFRMAVGGDLALDGAGGAHPGIGLRVQRTTGERGALELSATVDFPSQVGDDRVTFDVWRVPLALGVELALGRPRARWRFSLAGQGGIMLYAVSPSATSAGATAVSTTKLAGFVGGNLRLRLSIGARNALELGAGLDVVAAQPDIAYELGGADPAMRTEVKLDRPWYVQPHVGIWLVVW